MGCPCRSVEICARVDVTCIIRRLRRLIADCESAHAMRGTGFELPRLASLVSTFESGDPTDDDRDSLRSSVTSEEVGWGRFELPASSMSRRCHNQTRPPTRLLRGSRTLVVRGYNLSFRIGLRAAIAHTARRRAGVPIGLSQCTDLYITTRKSPLVNTMKEYIERVTDGDDLTQEARDAARAVFEDATEAQIGALLAALRAKGETEAEIAGFAQGMRDAALTIEPDRGPLVDTCGTGGDDYNTINVSTTSALVAAGAGVGVAKHGNYSVSSSSGSADVLEEVGVDIEAEPPDVEETIERDGVGFMLAPVFHPAMKAVIGPRKELGMRTVFNVLGPLTNPAGADAQVLGVYDPDLVPVMAEALARLDVERALVVHGDGLDEIAIHGETVVAEVTDDRSRSTPSPRGHGSGNPRHRGYLRRIAGRERGRPSRHRHR